MAWVVGFLQADGNIASNGDRISLCISRKDIEVIEFFRSEICPDSNFSIYNSSIKDRDKIYFTTRWGINSKTIKDDLGKIGIEPAKTGREVFCSVPTEYTPAYIRGIFDGDGHIGFYDYKIKRYLFQITCGSQQFLIDLKSWFGFGSVRKRSGTNCFDFVVGKQADIIKIYDILYNDDGFYLSRKKEKFQEVLKLIVNNKRKTSSIYRGVSYKNKGIKRWAAEVRKNNIIYGLGMFYTEEEAAMAYNEKAKEIFGDMAILNEIGIPKFSYNTSSQFPYWKELQE